MQKKKKLNTKPKFTALNPKLFFLASYQTERPQFKRKNHYFAR